MDESRPERRESCREKSLAPKRDEKISSIVSFSENAAGETNRHFRGARERRRFIYLTGTC